MITFWLAKEKIGNSQYRRLLLPKRPIQECRDCKLLRCKSVLIGRIWILARWCHMTRGGGLLIYSQRLGTLPIDDEGQIWEAAAAAFGTLSAPLNMQKLFILQEQKVFFKCKEGHSGQFVYVRDDRSDKEYFGLCEVEVFRHKGNFPLGYQID